MKLKIGAPKTISVPDIKTDLVVGDYIYWIFSNKIYKVSVVDKYLVCFESGETITNIEVNKNCYIKL